LNKISILSKSVFKKGTSKRFTATLGTRTWLEMEGK